MKRLLIFVLTYSLFERYHKRLLTSPDYCSSMDYRSSLEVIIMQKLYDSEYKVMNIVWDNEPITAKNISLIAADTVGWNKNTTYTIIKKLEAKGFLKREDPGFICTSLISRDQIQQSETQSLIDKLFGGSKRALFSALLEDEKLSDKEIKELREMIEKR